MFPEDHLMVSEGNLEQTELSESSVVLGVVQMDGNGKRYQKDSS